MIVRTFKNSCLRALSADVIGRLQLRPVVLPVRYEIEFPGNPIHNLYFVEEGMASMTTTFINGSQAEVGTFGIESVIGVSALMGTKRSLNRVYTLIAGSGYCSQIDLAKKEFQRGALFQAVALGYVQMQLVQTEQTAGCNARHDLEQRLARWILICADRTNRRTFPMSHEFLADMLGSTRPTVSVLANILKNAGLIEYRRGTMTILDIEGLEKRACECYKIIRNHLEDYVEFDPRWCA